MRVWGRLACDIEVWWGLAGVPGDPPTPPFSPLPLFIDPPSPLLYQNWGPEPGTIGGVYTSSQYCET
jgi:hypothetical protein